jgi:predicted small integral membrane protein
MNLPDNTRLYLYGIASAVVAALVAYGVIAAEQAPAILALVGAVLWAAGNVTAIVNTTSTGRAALYGVGLAVLAVLLTFRFITEEQVGVWGVVLAAVFGVGTNALAATKFTPALKADEVFAAGEPLEGEDI